MKRFLTTLAMLLFASTSALAAEDGLAVFLSRLHEPWAMFFVIGATLSAIPLVILLIIMIRGLFNQNQFYPQTKKATATSAKGTVTSSR